MLRNKTQYDAVLAYLNEKDDDIEDLSPIE